MLGWEADRQTCRTRGQVARARRRRLLLPAESRSIRLPPLLEAISAINLLLRPASGQARPRECPWPATCSSPPHWSATPAATPPPNSHAGFADHLLRPEHALPSETNGSLVHRQPSQSRRQVRPRRWRKARRARFIGATNTAPSIPSR